MPDPYAHITTREQAQDAAIQWQSETFSDDAPSPSMGELADAQAAFEALAEKFDLTDEFRENGVI